MTAGAVRAAGGGAGMRTGRRGWWRRDAALLAAALLVLGGGVAGCGKADSPATPATAPGMVIATSFYPMQIMTLNVAAGVPGVTVRMVAPPQAGCLHEYALTTRDLKIISTAQALVINGSGMESYIDKVVQQYPRLALIDASRDFHDTAAERAGKPDGHEAEHRHDDAGEHADHQGDAGAQSAGHEHHGEGVNPHHWVSISRALIQVAAIADQLAAFDPAHAAAYRVNAQAYIAKLTDLRVRMHAALDPLPQRTIVTFHEAFPYFAEEFNLTIAAVIEREPGTEPTPAEVTATVRQLRALGGKLPLFAEPQYSSSAAAIIARETGANVYYLNPGVTGDETPDAYLRTMERNMATLQQALRGE